MAIARAFKIQDSRTFLFDEKSAPKNEVSLQDGLDVGR